MRARVDRPPCRTPAPRRCGTRRRAPCARRGHRGHRPAACRSRCSPTSPSRRRRRRAPAHRTTRRRRGRPSRRRAAAPRRPPCAISCSAPSTALCSIGVDTAAVRPPSPRRARQTPMSAMLSASVPHEVKTISSADAPRHRRDALARLVERRARFATPPVHARRVAEARPEEGLHRGEHLLADGGRGGVVEVDWARAYA